MIINTLKLNWPNEQPQNARLQAIADFLAREGFEGKGERS